MLGFPKMKNSISSMFKEILIDKQIQLHSLQIHNMITYKKLEVTVELKLDYIKRKYFNTLEIIFSCYMYNEFREGERNIEDKFFSQIQPQSLFYRYTRQN